MCKIVCFICFCPRWTEQKEVAMSFITELLVMVGFKFYSAHKIKCTLSITYNRKLKLHSHKMLATIFKDFGSFMTIKSRILLPTYIRARYPQLFLTICHLQSFSPCNLEWPYKSSSTVPV